MHHKRTLIIAAIASLCVAACSSETEKTPAPDDVDAARAAAGRLGADLKERLMGAMMEGGPVAAVEVCRMEAPGIAAAASETTGMSVGRTALKLRNATNAPDAFERETLERFLADLESGADPVTLERIAVIESDEGEVFRYMKPIMTGAPCLACHGADVPEDIAQTIAAHYPDDNATGFAPGDLRGAFTVSKRLGP